MSQSDYLKYKREATVLKTQTKLPAVLTEDMYAGFIGYSLENGVTNTVLTPNQLLLPTKRRVFSMEMKTSSCPTFIACTDTNTRPNKVLHTQSVPTPHPIRPLYMKKVDSTVGNVENTDLCKCPVADGKDSFIVQNTKTFGGY